MLSFTQLLDSSTDQQEGRIGYPLDDCWMQGRAIYGGLSAALCLDGARKLFPALPPLRSASINFIGIASEKIWVEATVLRQGKSVTYVSSRLISEQGIVCDAVLCFGAARVSTLDANYGDKLYGDKTAIAGPDDAHSFYERDEKDGEKGDKKGVNTKKRPKFIQHFDTRVVKSEVPFSGSADPGYELWVRHADQNAKGIVALVALADMPPPAVMPALTQPAPVSSMTWAFNVLTDEFSQQGDWWLLGSFAEHAKDGYSSQNMTIHDESGELVVAGRQNVAVFS